MSDDLRVAIEKFAGCTAYSHSLYIRGLASEYAKQEEKLLKLRVASNMTIDQLTELLLQGYTLAPPTASRELAEYEDIGPPSEHVRPVRCGECIHLGAAFCMLGDSYDPQTEANKFCSEGARSK